MGVSIKWGGGFILGSLFWGPCFGVLSLFWGPLLGSYFGVLIILGPDWVPLMFGNSQYDGRRSQKPWWVYALRKKEKHKDGNRKMRPLLDCYPLARALSGVFGT